MGLSLPTLQKQKITKEFYEQLFNLKLDNLDKIVTFPERH